MERREPEKGSNFIRSVVQPLSSSMSRKQNHTNRKYFNLQAISFFKLSLTRQELEKVFSAYMEILQEFYSNEEMKSSDREMSCSWLVSRMDDVRTVAEIGNSTERKTYEYNSHQYINRLST